MNEFFAVLLVLLLAVSGYIAGRMHGQYSYHVGYRFGYRHGYYDGDRASWNRRRRELQNAVASVMREPETPRQATPGGRATGTTYASSAYAEPVAPEPAADGDGAAVATDKPEIEPGGPAGSVVAERAARPRRPRGWPTAGGVRRA
ncbi:hypothetical protein GCM10009681_00790 [Luedemannella helvata]|uniref:Uncharacterized protein n=1 Tax=Luedemannella helvata TaxID=349315 RepID=A0ABP4VSX7_9ACTN